MNSIMYQKIEGGTAHVKSRVMASNFAMKSEENLKELISIAFDIHHELHIKAFWSLDLVGEKKLKLLVPYLDAFCEVLPKIKNDSSLRPATRIAMFLAKSNHRKNGITLSQEQEHNLIEALIDRLIQDEKVASKAYAMKALFVFGKKHDWIYEELKPILSQDYANHSAGYKAAAKNILKRMK
ncbi:hypothetical protein [Flavobacterium sp.]|uniref:hypothetical protein n=1 Tax=Flavobacterium sp. TaxID=239 RepID=UPI0035279351